MTAPSFADLGLIDPLQRALVGEGYLNPTPIQAQAIPHLLAGRDVLGCAQTGTGKTAAFALPILDRLERSARPAGKRGPRALILTPTRELAVQIADGFAAYGRHVKTTRAVIFGGVGQGPQVDALRRNVDVIVATPGRLLDLMNQRHAIFEALEVLVLDEADRMLDMGFIDPIRRIIAALPRKRQNLMFSATMPPDIARLADNILVSPIKVAVTPVSSTVDNVTQWVLFVNHADKRSLLTETLRDPAMTRVLVFTRTKHGANRLAQQLDKGGVRTEAIHGNKSQGARQRALDAFKSGRVRVLVATDIAARGIDVDGVSHVINFDLPNEPESYVHRIGRTARAGNTGVALSFCSGDERTALRDIERLTRKPLQVVQAHPYSSSSGAREGGRPAPGWSGRGGRSDRPRA
ncbi:MAG TPA: DEAD/DEAH box helicase [Polyangia bacterium]|nr:DEAD/DEAH box helicase [Polyangia bacterium]